MALFSRRYGWCFIAVRSANFRHRFLSVRLVFLLSTVFRFWGYGQHLFGTEIKTGYGCINSCTEIEVQPAFNCCTEIKEVQPAFNAGHRNRGVRTAVNAGHDFQDFEIKSWVKISCIFTVFLFWFLLKEIKSLSLWLVFPVGVFPGLILAKNLWVKIYGVTVGMCFFSLLVFLLCV